MVSSTGRPAMCRLSLAITLLTALTVAACATQREQRLSSAEAAQRPSDLACEPKGLAPTPRSIWACGYWHWDRVRYVWIEGSWQEPR